MSKKLIRQIDDLAQEFEARGELVNAAALDEIGNLLTAAEQEIPQDVSDLANLLMQYINIQPEEAIAASQELFAKYGCKDVSGAELEGELGFPTNISPVGMLPYKERREGPRPEDVPVGQAEWWTK